MTNAEVTLLGLLSEAPCYGYELEKIITERKMRDWTEIGFSSIYYILHKLAKKNLVVKKTEEKKSGPTRKVFSITPEGEKALRSALRRMFTFPSTPINNFDLALFFKDTLPPDEIYNNMLIYKSILIKKIAAIQDSWSELGGYNLSLSHQLYFSRTIILLEAELKWIEENFQDTK